MTHPSLGAALPPRDSHGENDPVRELELIAPGDQLVDTEMPEDPRIDQGVEQVGLAV